MWYTERIYKLGIINIPNNTIGIPCNMITKISIFYGKLRQDVFDIPTSSRDIVI